MSATLPLSHHRGVTAADRLGLTLFFAVVLHVLLILGVGFNAPSSETRPTPPTLDVVLTDKRSSEAPEEAEYLGATSHDGGGNVSEPIRPETRRADPAASQARSTPLPPVDPTPAAAPAAPTQVVTARQAPRRVLQHPSPNTEQRKESPTAAQLWDLSMEMARLEAGIHDNQRAYSKRKRQRYIDASTREHLYAAYMAAWVSKVERVGNLNYPSEARRQGLSGALILDVALNPDGTISAISLLRSSGHRVLDDAAIRIVRLAAPYARFPKAMRDQIDLLHITKTWQFLGNNRWAGG